MCDKKGLDEIPCRQKPCQPSPERPCDPSEDTNSQLSGRPILYTGVIWIGIVRRFLIPRSCGPCQPPSTPGKLQEGSSPRSVAHLQPAVEESPEPPLARKQKPRPVNTKEDELEDEELESPLLSSGKRKKEAQASPLSALVVQVHEVSASAAAQARAISDDVVNLLRTGQETTSEMIETVRSKKDKTYRLGAISGSGLVGYLVGRQRGLITRLVYSTTGATAMAAICYPEETKMYNRGGLATVRQWIVLGLSFVRGGPEKPIGGGDLKVTNCKNTQNYEDYEETDQKSDVTENSQANVYTTENSQKDLYAAENSQPNLYATETLVTDLMQSLGALGHHLEEMKAKLQNSDVSTKLDEFPEEKGLNSGDLIASASDTINALRQDLQHRMTNRSEKLDSKEETPVMKVLPPDSVSPVLPNPSKNKHGPNDPSTPETHRDTLLTTPVEETSINKRNTDEIYESSMDDPEDDDADEDALVEDLEEEGDLFSDDYSTMTFIIPTGGLEEKLGGGHEPLKKVNSIKKNQIPLNKKLSGFYRNMPEEEKTSREKGYDDAYSNRG